MAMATRGVTCTILVSLACWLIVAGAAAAAEPKVTKVGLASVDRGGLECPRDKQLVEAGLGSRICVVVEGLSAWVAGAEGKPNDPTKVQLVIDGRPLQGLAPRLASDQSLVFDLVYTSDAATRAEWNQIFRQKDFRRTVGVTVRLKPDAGFLESTEKMELVVVPLGWLTLWAAVFIGLLVLFLILAIKSDVLRDAGPEPRPGPNPSQPPRKPFSLSRCQMAFWFFIILASYLLIGLITGNWESLTGQAAALMGISAATGVAARTVEATKRNTTQTEKSKNSADQATLQGRATSLVQEMAGVTRQLQAATPPPAAKAEELRQTYAQKQAEQNSVLSQLHEIAGNLKRAERTLTSPATEGPVLDLLSDTTGVALHRFQMAAWTLVLGIIFLAAAYRTLVMQEFSEALLLLMGISGGTYVAFKIPERSE